MIDTFLLVGLINVIVAFVCLTTALATAQYGSITGFILLAIFGIANVLSALWMFNLAGFFA